MMAVKMGTPISIGTGSGPDDNAADVAGIAGCAGIAKMTSCLRCNL